MSDLNEAVCPQPSCNADIDAPEALFFQPGAELTCPSCDSICFMTVYVDGNWRLTDPDEDRATAGQQPERISKAAVRIDAVLYQDRETGKKTTLVFDVPRPLRHDSALMATAAALRLERLGEHEQGFTTTLGRFVGRREAAHLAFHANQTVNRLAGLTSEDVW